MRKYLKHSAIQVYQNGKEFYGWNLFVDDDFASSSGYNSPETAIQAAQQSATLVEQRYAQKDTQLAKIQASVDTLNTESIAKCWIEALPGGDDWIVHYIKDTESYAATLHFRALGG